MYAFICVLCDKWTQSWNGYCLYDCVINTCINLCLALLCTYLFAVVVTVLHPHTVRTVRSINETCTINVRLFLCSQCTFWGQFVICSEKAVF